MNLISGPENDDSFSDEIECARCSERFYYELLECPNCGARVYSGFDEEEDEMEAEEGPGGHRGWFIEFGAVLSGWFIAALIVTALFLPLRNAFSLQRESLPEQILLFILASLSGFIAAWIVVRSIGRRWKLHGILAGMGSLFAAAGLYWILYAHFQPLLRSVAAWAAVPVVLLVSWSGAVLAERMFRTPDADSLFGSATQEKLLYQRLLAITRNDSATVERLIAYEKQRLPRASRLDLMKRAVERWERDNR